MIALEGLRVNDYGVRFRGHVNSCAFLTEYDRLRDEGMPIEQAMIFVGHHFRMWHLQFQPVR